MFMTSFPTMRLVQAAQERMDNIPLSRPWSRALEDNTATPSILASDFVVNTDRS